MPVDRLLHPRCSRSIKVGTLSDADFRIWIQYLLSADDFGVMPFSAVVLQAQNTVLEKRAMKAIQAGFERLVKVGLLHTFEHQGTKFVFQHDWQDWQKVEYPRATLEPCPPSEALAICSEATRSHFLKHPGGSRTKRRRNSGSGGEGDPNDSEHVRDAHPEGVPTTRAGARAKRLTANGQRLAAYGSEGGPEGTAIAAPLDVWLRQLQAQYPPQGLTSGHLTESAFVDVFTEDGRAPDVVFAEMLEHLENQLRGYQWRVKRMIPRLERWLREGLWRQLHDEQPPTAIVSEQTLHTMAAGDAFVKAGGTHGTH